MFETYNYRSRLARDMERQKQTHKSQHMDAITFRIMQSSLRLSCAMVQLRMTSQLVKNIFVTVCIVVLMPTRSTFASCARSGCSSGTSACHGLSRIRGLPNNTRTNVLLDILEDYDSLTRPDNDDGEATDVICDLYINSFDSVSVDQMDYSVNIYSRLTWADNRLSYASSFPGVSSLTLDSKLLDMIWVPDQFFPNEKQAHSHCVTVPNRLIRIYPNGTVLYSARYTLKVTCHMSLRYFPVDKQVCLLFLESFGYTESELQFRWRYDNPIQVNEHLELPQFDLATYGVGNCSKSYITGNFTCLKVMFYLDRKYGYYLIQNYIPSLLIVVLSWVSFWINIDAVPARISLGVLTVLTMTTQTVGAWMSLPRVSYIKAIDIWMSTCVFFVFAAILEFALVNTLARKEIRRLSMKVRADPQNVDNGSDVIKRMVDEYTYGQPEILDPSSRNLARNVDKVSRRVFPVTFILFNMVYWCVFLLTG